MHGGTVETSAKEFLHFNKTVADIQVEYSEHLVVPACEEELQIVATRGRLGQYSRARPKPLSHNCSRASKDFGGGRHAVAVTVLNVESRHGSTWALGAGLP